MTRLLKRLWPEERAQSLPEYTLLIFFITLTAVTAMSGLASRINVVCSGASTRVEAASRSGSLAGGSLGYGTSAQAKNPSDLNVDSRLNPN